MIKIFMIHDCTSTLYFIYSLSTFAFCNLGLFDYESFYLFIIIIYFFNC